MFRVWFIPRQAFLSYYSLLLSYTACGHFTKPFNPDENALNDLRFNCKEYKMTCWIFWGCIHKKWRDTLRHVWNVYRKDLMHTDKRGLEKDNDIVGRGWQQTKRMI